MEAFQLGYDPEHLSIVTVPHPDDPSRYDEIDRLGITFEDMQHTIAGNLKSIVNLSVNEERLKYQLLQSQINPHFLYNILGSIRTCQSLGKLDIADQMIANLTAFYRLTLRKSKELIPISELEIARLYLEMEKLCHKDNLDWEIEAEDGIENFLICKFTLQPFLENSILHGISSGTPAVFISIHVLYGDDTVVISIEDNGAGMDPETLAQLHHAIEHNVIDYEKHFGISNVSSRISNPLYGNGSVRIRSNPGNGTYVQPLNSNRWRKISMKKIMIVDDNYLSAEGIEKNIDWETLNAEIIHVCYNGTSAIEAMKKEPADLIISDIEMPDLDGISMSRQAS